jgi:hypothetical protein
MHNSIINRLSLFFKGKPKYSEAQIDECIEKVHSIISEEHIALTLAKEQKLEKMFHIIFCHGNPDQMIRCQEMVTNRALELPVGNQVRLALSRIAEPAVKYALEYRQGLIDNHAEKEAECHTINHKI